MSQHRYTLSICLAVLMVAVFITYLFYPHTSTRWINVFHNFATSRHLSLEYDHYYAKLGEAFLAKQLHLHDVPSNELMALSNPYSYGQRTAPKVPYLWDAVLFDGKYYLYFGPVPALMPWIPVKWLLGITLTDKTITLFYATLGTFSLLILLYLCAQSMGLHPLPPRKMALIWFCATLPLCFGAAIPLLLKRPMFYEAAIAGAYAYMALGLLLLWIAYNTHTRRSILWKYAASLCFGLAAGCRLIHGLNVLILLACWIVPAWEALKEKNYAKILKDGIALFLPWFIIIASLALYNYERFGSVFETGMRYQLTLADIRNLQAQWSWQNFTHHLYDYSFTTLGDTLIPWKEGFGMRDADLPFGLITHSPFVLFALVGFFYVRDLRYTNTHALALASAMCIYLTICFVFVASHSGARGRYMVDFAPWLMLIASVGFLYYALNARYAWRRNMILTLGVVTSLWTVYSGLAAFACVSC